MSARCFIVVLVAFIGLSEASKDCTTCKIIELNSPRHGPVTRITLEGACKIKKLSLRTPTDFAKDNNLCWQDYTYGFIGTDVFVDLGCGGTFKVCYIEGYLEKLTCRSDGDPKFCEYSNGKCLVQSAIVEVAKSEEPCIRDYSFHAFDDKLIASKNCKGSFIVGCEECD